MPIILPVLPFVHFLHRKNFRILINYGWDLDGGCF